MAIISKNTFDKERETKTRQLVDMAGALFADNDNTPSAIRKRPTVPRMHADPFTPEAAGGILQDVAHWITSTAIVKVPELSLASAIALFSGMFGSKALGATRTGVNIFFVTVMGVGSGKGHAPKAIGALAGDAGRPGAVTNGDPTSYAAIERILRKNPSTVIVMDEFGVTLQDVNSRQKNPASASIRKFLLAIYDQADGKFDGRQYASSDTKKDDLPIEGPALTVLGMTTEETLFAGLSEDSIGEGFLSRFVFVTGSAPKNIRPPKLDRASKPPAAIIAALRNALTSFPKPAGAFGFLGKHLVPFDGGEDGEAYQRWSEVFLWQHWPGWAKRERDLNGRAAENTLRLATVRAISRNPTKPAVTAEDIEWAWGIVYRSIELITAGVERHMSGSKFESLRKAIVAALEEAKSKQLPWSFLLQRAGVSQAEPDDVSKALSWLIDTGRVASLVPQQRPGPKGKFALLAA